MCGRRIWWHCSAMSAAVNGQARWQSLLENHHPAKQEPLVDNRGRSISHNQDSQWLHSHTRGILPAIILSISHDSLVYHCFRQGQLECPVWTHCKVRSQHCLPTPEPGGTGWVCLSGTAPGDGLQQGHFVRNSLLEKEDWDPNSPPPPALTWACPNTALLGFHTSDLFWNHGTAVKYKMES